MTVEPFSVDAFIALLNVTAGATPTGTEVLPFVGEFAVTVGAVGGLPTTIVLDFTDDGPDGDVVIVTVYVPAAAYVLG